MAMIVTPPRYAAAAADCVEGNRHGCRHQRPADPTSMRVQGSAHAAEATRPPSLGTLQPFYGGCDFWIGSAPLQCRSALPKRAPEMPRRGSDDGALILSADDRSGGG
jgi:hypothetical protein